MNKFGAMNIERCISFCLTNERDWEKEQLQLVEKIHEVVALSQQNHISVKAIFVESS